MSWRHLAAPAVLAVVVPAQRAEPDAGLVALHQAVLDAGRSAVVLNVAAHPDDESSRTNTVLRRKHGMRVVTAYTTYGDGGQNAIGREIGLELAALRVRETLRAAALSGVEVRWLGMDDFGFSKTLDETLRQWGEARLLAAMRKVVDEVDPDFVLTNHSLTQGHGHHRATFWAIDAVLRERAAAKARVPALLTRSKLEEAVWIVDPTELDPARGETYARLAHRAWVQHVTQGPWGPHNPLQVGKDFWKVANADAASLPPDGEAAPPPWRWVAPRGDPSWRLPDGVGELPREQLRTLARALHQRLAERRELLRVAPAARAEAAELEWRLAAVRTLLLALANVSVEAWLERDEVAAGADGKVNVIVHGAERVAGIEVRCGERSGTPVTAPVRAMLFDGVPVTPAGTVPATAEPAAAPANPPTVPGPAGRFAVAFAAEPPTGGPEPRSVRVVVAFALDDLPLQVERTLHYTPVPAVELAWDREVVMAPRGSTLERVLSVTVTSHDEKEQSAPIRLGLPPGVQAVPLPSRLSLSREHDQARLLLKATITADELPADARIEVGFGDARSSIRVVPVDVSVPPGLRVALVRGPDDSTERALADLGVPFTALDRDALALARLDDFTTVLLDIRAYHHRPELAEVRDRLLQFCRGGGRVVAMYHKPGEWNERAGRPLLAPFPLLVGEERATEEDAAVAFLQPEHPLLRHPHALGPADFAGWVQERGLNFPKSWDPAWTPLLAMRDTDDPKPHEGALLVTRYGRGDFVYCSLALYRQLRIGHGGAARLLVNLLARG